MTSIKHQIFDERHNNSRNKNAKTDSFWVYEKSRVFGPAADSGRERIDHIYVIAALLPIWSGRIGRNIFVFVLIFLFEWRDRKISLSPVRLHFAFLFPNFKEAWLPSIPYLVLSTYSYPEIGNPFGICSSIRPLLQFHARYSLATI